MAAASHEAGARKILDDAEYALAHLSKVEPMQNPEHEEPATTI